MRAVVYERYGPPDVLELREVPDPVVGDRDVLVRVIAASVNRSDWEGLIGRPAYVRMGGLLRPKTQILGTDVAGVVEQVGGGVERFRPGDHVFGDVMYHGGKAFAEYVCVSETAPLELKPPSISFAQASTLPQAGVIAIQGVEGKVDAGSRVLVNGAGGGAGGFAIQLAKSAGAHVTAVDNALKQEFMSSLGADEVIDYARSDYTRSGEYDLILDLVCERSMFAVRRAVAPGGRYRVVGGNARSLISALTLGRVLSAGGRSIGVLLVRPNRNDVAKVADMVVEGSLKTAIDRTFRLEEAPEALRYVGDGRALGKVVIAVGP